MVLEEAAVGSWKNCMMAMVAEQQEESPSAVNYLLGKLEQFYPVCGFSETLHTNTKSKLATHRAKRMYLPDFLLLAAALTGI